jgi:hypothetical protein
LGLLFRPCAANPIVAASLRAQTRWAHTNEPVKLTDEPAKFSPKLMVPPTTPFVPDVETFLTLIGRDLKQHASKFPTWDALFTMRGPQMKELGVDPARKRRYLCRWLHAFREGRFGPGGDLLYVENGVAKLGILKTEEDAFKTLRHVVNIPPGKKLAEVPREQLARPKGYKVVRNCAIAGPYALPTRGGGAVVKVTEGMWEWEQGRKIDGGERRQAEVRFKRRVAERKAARERQH